MDINWNSSFIGTPADTDEAKYGASKIRELKVAIEERITPEHDIDTGKHLPGKSSVAFIGTTTEINALTGMSEGAIAYDETLSIYKIYHDEEWTTFSFNHSLATNLNNSENTLDPHPQYFRLNKSGQTITEDLAILDTKKVDGRDLSVDGTKLDALSLTISNITNFTFTSSGIITRSTGSFLEEGFVQDDIIHTTSITNPGPFSITSITATQIVTSSTSMNNESAINIRIYTKKIIGDLSSVSYAFNTIYGPEPYDCFIIGMGRGYSYGAHFWRLTGRTNNVNSGLLSGDTYALGMAGGVEGRYSGYPSSSFTMPVKRNWYWAVTLEGSAEVDPYFAIKKIALLEK